MPPKRSLTLAGAPDDGLRFAAAAALAKLGHAAALPALKAEVETGLRAPEALRLLAGLLSDADFRSFLGTLYRRDETRALAVRGIGMTGDRRHLGWLIDQMETPETATSAGESFLELFPEAEGVESLFGERIWSSGLAPDAEPLVLEDCPIAGKIREWATSRAADEATAR